MWPSWSCAVFTETVFTDATAPPTSVAVRLSLVARTILSGVLTLMSKVIFIPSFLYLIPLASPLILNPSVNNLVPLIRLNGNPGMSLTPPIIPVVPSLVFEWNTAFNFGSDFGTVSNCRLALEFLYIDHTGAVSGTVACCSSINHPNFWVFEQTCRLYDTGLG